MEGNARNFFKEKMKPKDNKKPYKDELLLGIVEDIRLDTLGKKQAFRIRYVLNRAHSFRTGMCGRTAAKESGIAWDIIMEEK